MTADSVRAWESDLIDCPSTTLPTMIAIVRGGESIVIKSEATQGGYHLIGPKHIIEAGRGYRLYAGETMEIGLQATFGMNNVIEIWALPGTAGDDITWFKVKISNTEGIAEIENLKRSLKAV